MESAILWRTNSMSWNSGTLEITGTVGNTVEKQLSWSCRFLETPAGAGNIYRNNKLTWSCRSLDTSAEVGNIVEKRLPLMELQECRGSCWSW